MVDEALKMKALYSSETLSQSKILHSETTQKTAIIFIAVKTSYPTYYDFIDLATFHVRMFNFIYTPIHRFTNFRFTKFRNNETCKFIPVFQFMNIFSLQWRTNLRPTAERPLRK
jgi:hypothetical protein